MPVTSSAKKALRVSLRKRKVNLIWKNKLASHLKQAKRAVASGAKEAPKVVSETIQVIDKAVKHNLIKKNAGARLKSQLQSAFAKKLGKTTKLPKIKKPQSQAPKKTTVAKKAAAKPKSPATKKPTAKKSATTKNPAPKK